MMMLTAIKRFWDRFFLAALACGLYSIRASALGLLQRGALTVAFGSGSAMSSKLI